MVISNNLSNVLLKCSYWLSLPVNPVMALAAVDAVHSAVGTTWTAWVFHRVLGTKQVFIRFSSLWTKFHLCCRLKKPTKLQNNAIFLVVVVYHRELQKPWNIETKCPRVFKGSMNAHGFLLTEYTSVLAVSVITSVGQIR